MLQTRSSLATFAFQRVGSMRALTKFIVLFAVLRIHAIKSIANRVRNVPGAFLTAANTRSAATGFNYNCRRYLGRFAFFYTQTSCRASRAINARTAYHPGSDHRQIGRLLASRKVQYGLWTCSCWVEAKKWVFEPVTA